MSVKLQELSRQTIRVTREGNYGIEWSGNTLCVHTDRGLQTFDLTCDLNTYDKVIAVETSFLLCPSSAPITEVIKSCCNTKVINSHESTFCIDPALWSHSVDIASAMGIITSSEWSPADPGRHRSVLALLTSNGCVGFYVRRNNTLKIISDLTSSMVKEKVWPKTNDVNTVRKYCKELQSSSICWGDTLNSDYRFFVTAQRNHKIVFWKVSMLEKTASEQFVNITELESDIGEIKTLTWIPKKQGRFSLIYSSVSGIIKILDGTVKGDGIIIASSQDLWRHPDRMILSHIVWFHSGENVIVVGAKHRHLLITLLAEDNTVLDQYVQNVNDYRISALIKTCEGLYVSTENFSIQRLNIVVKHNKVNVEYISVLLKDDYSDYTLHSLAVSSNEAIWTFSVTTKTRVKQKRDFVTLIFLKYDDFIAINVLLENPSDKLTEMWDCLELLRLQMIGKKKCLPDANIEEIFSDPNLSTYYMKLYLKLWTLYHKVDYIRHLPADSVFSTLSPHVIKDTILIRQAIYLIDVLFQRYRDTGELSKFQKETMLSCYRYAECYCNKYKSDISVYVNSDALAFAKTETVKVDYKCVYCDQNLEEYQCKDGHPNQFCSVSLQHITGIEYLACRVCGSTAHIGLAMENPMCTFCDLLMEQFC